MEQVSVKDLLEAGVHFGHQTHRWNPKMRSYIFTQKGGIHIIDLQQTEAQMKDAVKAVSDVVALGGWVLFVGTKRQAQMVVQREAERSGQPFVTNRWLGGMLTNFKTIKQSINRLLKLTAERDGGGFEKMIKKEALMKEREIEKLDKNFKGIKNMQGLPSAIFIVDPKIDEITRKEANKLNIPVIAICDTNADPDKIDYPIAGNDDAIRSIELITKAVADACLDGAVRHETTLRDQAAKKKDAPEEKGKGKRVIEKKIGGRGRAYVGGRRGEEPIVSDEEVQKFASAKAEKTEKVEEKEEKKVEAKKEKKGE